MFTYKLLPTPNPPATTKAPVVVLPEGVVLLINIALVVELPLSVTVCSVLVFHTVTTPVLVLTAVSVPATNAVTP